MADVSRETSERLHAYADLLLAWNRKINLVGTTRTSELWERHIEDCLQLDALIPPGAAPIVDLGSGAGLPGLILAIARPSDGVVCVESDRRKAAFLTQVVRTLDLDVKISIGRIEDIPPLQAPVVTARALAPLPQLLAYVHRHLRDGGNAYLMKGQRWQEELEKARASWHFSCEAASSRTNPNAVILKIGGLVRA